MKRLAIDPKIKSACSGYRDQATRIMSFRHKSFQLRKFCPTEHIFHIKYVIKL